MTVQDLLRHTAGLPYGELTQNAAVKDALAKAGLFKPGVIEFDVRDMTGAEQVERLARIPLLYQPGTTWEYSLATDVLGRVVEAASGKRLGDLHERAPVHAAQDDRHGVLGRRRRSWRAWREPFDKDPLAGTAITADRRVEGAGATIRAAPAAWRPRVTTCASPRCWPTAASSTVSAC